jgi:hypothetical protein
VHIRRAKFDVAQCRRFETGIVVGAARHRGASYVFIHGTHADIVKIVVGKNFAAVTGVALRLQINFASSDS